MASSSVISNDTMSPFLWSGSHNCGSPSSEYHNLDSMIEGDYQRSHHSSPETSTSSSPSDSRPDQYVPVKSELTSSPDFRLSRPSAVLPRNPQPLTSPKVAISASKYNTSNTSGQDVRPSVNTSALYPSSTATRSDVYPSYYETNVSSSTPSDHVLTHPRNRLRTNKVFTSPHALCAHHDIPQHWPTPPSTTPRTQSVSQPERHQPAIPDFQSLASNYLNMLAQNPTNNNMTNDSISPVDTVSPSEVQPSNDQANLQAIVDLLKQESSFQPTSPDIPFTPDFEEPSPEFGFITPDAFSSPMFSPSEDFLTTPVMGDMGDMFTGPYDSLFADSEMTLFPEMVEMGDYVNPAYEKAPAPPPVVPPASAKMYVLSPSSPMLHSFSPAINPNSIYPSPRLPSNRSLYSSPAPSSVSANRRRSSATGTRKGLTPETLVPDDAPTQPRKYITPSATSRKEIPAGFAKKRARSQAFGDEDDELMEEPLRPGATEQEQIEYKRRQNTVAARRSRKRKLQHTQELEAGLARMTRERDVWKTRTEMLQGMLQANHLAVPHFPDDVEDQE